MGDYEGTMQIKHEDISMKTIFLPRFWINIRNIALRWKFFFYTLTGFKPYWDYKPSNAIHAESTGRCTSEKILKLSTFNKTLLESNVLDRSLLNGLRQLILYNFI